MVVAFACVEAWQWRDRTKGFDGKYTVEASLVNSRGPGLRDQNTAGLSALILAKPLFTIGRRVRKSNGKVIVKGPEAMPRLTGIIVAPSGRRGVFVTAGGASVVLRTGQAIGNITVSQITSGYIVLHGPGGNVTVRPIYPTLGAGQEVPVESPIPVLGASPPDPATDTGTRRVQVVVTPLGPVTLPLESAGSATSASPSRLTNDRTHPK
jgi:hypothetical protein